MEKRYTDVDMIFNVIIAILWGILAAVFIDGLIIKDDYKQGQIDALNGKVFYCLKKSEDGSIKWVRREERKDK